MRSHEAMAEAEVGDDVYRDDPTVNKLEAMAADMLGKDAAIFVPSGTMGNLLAHLRCRFGHSVRSKINIFHCIIHFVIYSTQAQALWAAKPQKFLVLFRQAA